ncbi:MAG: RT0821/Lpp0805 family surface protein [Pseudolabrys sp.]
MAAALALALASGGCSLSGQFDSFFGSDKGDQTGSIPSQPAKSVAELPPETDLVFARAAASELLRRGQKDASLTWENPKTGARGTVTPIASAYRSEGRTCHDFLASYVTDKAQSWLQGEACKEQKGAWEVRAFKPWNRS